MYASVILAACLQREVSIKIKRAHICCSENRRTIALQKFLSFFWQKKIKKCFAYDMFEILTSC